MEAKNGHGYNKIQQTERTANDWKRGRTNTKSLQTCPHYESLLNALSQCHIDHYNPEHLNEKIPDFINLVNVLCPAASTRGSAGVSLVWSITYRKTIKDFMYRYVNKP